MKQQKEYLKFSRFLNLHKHIPKISLFGALTLPTASIKRHVDHFNKRREIAMRKWSLRGGGAIVNSKSI